MVWKSRRKKHRLAVLSGAARDTGDAGYGEVKIRFLAVFSG